MTSDLWFESQPGRYYDNMYVYSKNCNTGARQKMAVHDVMLFKIFDWTMASIIAFDWL